MSNNPDVATQDSNEAGIPAPTFHVLGIPHHGGGFTATATYPVDGDQYTVFAGVRQIFNPRITNRSAVDVWIRRPGQAWPVNPEITRYPINKADSITLKKNGMELQIFCGTHITGDGTIDGDGARDYYTEKDQIPGFFIGWDEE